MDYYKNDLYRNSNFCVYKNEDTFICQNYIPFYMNFKCLFYSSVTGIIYNEDIFSIQTTSLLNLRQITSQENIIVCNDDSKLYICSDDFEVLCSFDIKVNSNYVIFGFEVYFIDKDLTHKCLNLVTKTISNSEDSNIWRTKTCSDISGYIDETNKLVICDTTDFTKSNDENFKFGGAKVRVGHIVQLHYSKIFDNDTFTDSDNDVFELYDVFDFFLKELCLSTQNIKVNDDDRQFVMKLFDKEYLDSFIRNNSIYTRDEHYNNRIILSSDNNLINEKMKSKVTKIFYGLYNSKYMPVGPFYYYAPLHALSWHTNMGDSGPDTYRMYTVYCEKDYESFFCYKHPVSGLIHILGDKNMHTEVFNIGPVDKPFWHAVINPTTNMKRMSLGFMLDNDLEKIFTKEQLKALLARYKE